MPAGLLDRICEMRAFVASKSRYSAAARKEDIPTDLPLLDVVVALEAELVMERIRE